MGLRSARPAHETLPTNLSGHGLNSVRNFVVCLRTVPGQTRSPQSCGFAILSLPQDPQIPASVVPESDGSGPRAKNFDLARGSPRRSCGQSLGNRFRAGRVRGGHPESASIPILLSNGDCSTNPNPDGPQSTPSFRSPPRFFSRLRKREESKALSPWSNLGPPPRPPGPFDFPCFQPQIGNQRGPVRIRNSSHLLPRRIDESPIFPFPKAGNVPSIV